MDPILLAMLSPETRAALMAHMAPEKSMAIDDVSVVADTTSDEFTHVRNTNAGVDENFGMSQFWYTRETATTLAKEALSIGGQRDKLKGMKRVGFLSCPSAFKAALPIVPDDTEIIVFEYDRRFGKIYGDKFCYFDFNYPENLPEEMFGTFDYLMADPPYLDEFTMMQTYKAMKMLARDENTPMCYNTASTMDELMAKLISFKECQFHPEHASKLGNDFSCFTSYNAEGLLTWYPDALLTTKELAAKELATKELVEDEAECKTDSM